MPKNNSAERRKERRKKAARKMRVHASNPHGCTREVSKHTDAEHEAMLNEAIRIEAKGI